jgi:hypothetical protein
MQRTCRSEGTQDREGNHETNRRGSCKPTFTSLNALLSFDDGFVMAAEFGKMDHFQKKKVGPPKIVVVLLSPNLSVYG